MMTRNTACIERGTGEYRRANLALFIAGFVTFSTLHDFQPLLPILAREFGVAAATASLPLSVATLALALTLPVSGTLSDAFGRRRMMAAALAATSLLTLATTLAGPLPSLIALRLLQGVVLAGVPAVAMAYLGEEMSPRAVDAAMGLYIAGNAMGGMTGRILTACLTDLLPWREAVAVIGGLSLGLAALFILLLPPSRRFRRRPFRPGPLTLSLFGLLREPGLLCLFAVAFTGMGAFVTLYNYVTFRLLAPPYGLTQAQASWIFLAYAFGAGGSGAMGHLVERAGRGRILLAALAVTAGGALLTLLAPLAAVIAGIVIFTIGFFGAHAVASTWVGARAGHARAQASWLYLFFYYLGASVIGSGGGFAWSAGGWKGVTLLVVALLGLAALAVLRLTTLAGRAARETEPAEGAMGRIGCGSGVGE
jgi:YNFM family putative membrane transporter